MLINVDLIDISARVAELSRLVSDLPPPNYALLRAFTAHLILIVRNAPTNKMTLRNIGIVFSPTLGIPAGIFSELVTHFGAIFDDAGEEEAEVSEEQTGWSVPSDDVDETMTRKRNSMLYQAGGADLMLGLGGRSLDPGGFDFTRANLMVKQSTIRLRKPRSTTWNPKPRQWLAPRTCRSLRAL